MSFSKIVIEVCVDSVESASDAVLAGADRIELCANLGLGGGTTPSIGFLKAVQKAIPKTPIMAMVRPRTGDFLYSQAEFEVMLEDIRSFQAQGAAGVVMGVLKSDGAVDVGRMKLLVHAAWPLEVCFHRAFDMSNDIRQALIDVMSIPGITRILTSGHGKSAPSSISTLQYLLREAKTSAEQQGSTQRLTILPGSGINPTTVGAMIDALAPSGLREIHLSGGRWLNGGMSYRPEGMGMGVGGDGEWGVWRTNRKTIGEVRSIVDSAKAFNTDTDGART